MIKIKKVTNQLMAQECDNLLTKLIQAERRFDKNTKETFIVNDNYTNKFDKDQHILFLAYHAEVPVGYIYGYLKEEKGDFVYDSVAHIDALYILEDYRKMGIASSLIDKFYEWCKNQNVKFVTIGVYKDNVEAYNLYCKQGFEIDAYYMTKVLQ